MNLTIASAVKHKQSVGSPREDLDGQIIDRFEWMRQSGVFKIIGIALF
jgi:hypothetical protein